MTKLVLREVDTHLVLFEDDTSTTTFRDFFFTHDAFESLRNLFADEFTAMEEEITKRGGGRIIFEEDQMRIDFPKN
jgi:hypothetical protein